MTDENAVKIIEQLTLIANHLQSKQLALQNIDERLAGINGPGFGDQPNPTGRLGIALGRAVGRKGNR